MTTITRPGQIRTYAQMCAFYDTRAQQALDHAAWAADMAATMLAEGNVDTATELANAGAASMAEFRHIDAMRVSPVLSR